MDVAEFQEWSGGIARLSRAQRRQTFQTLALSEASDSYDDDLGECREVDAVTAVSGDTPGGTLAAAEPSMPAPLSRAQTDGLAGLGQRRVKPRVPPLRRPRGHALGKGEWRATIPLQKLRADLQRSDENAVGPFAEER
jgi:hypothetical protein